MYEMNEFRKSNRLLDVNEEMMTVSTKLKEFEAQREVELTKLNYLNSFIIVCWIMLD